MRWIEPCVSLILTYLLLAHERAGSLIQDSCDLADELERFIQGKIESGRYKKASDVVGRDLRALERDERAYEAKLSALRVAEDEIDDIEVMNGNPLDRIRSAIKPPNQSA